MGANGTSTQLQRHECRQCGSHTFSDVCGCCYGGDLVPVAVNPIDLGHPAAPRHAVGGFGLSAFGSGDDPRLPGR